MERTKIGVSFNCFSATELLPYAIKQLRPIVDYIVCVVQKTSYQGKPFYKDNQNIINDLYESGLIDNVVYYTNTKEHPKKNECNKRNYGVEILQDNGCTHFMTMDEDELYHTEELKEAFDYLTKNNYDSSACMMQTYYKKPTLKVYPPESYFVPLLYKLDNRRFKIGNVYPVLADPSRKLTPTKHYTFGRNQIEMHHFSYIRKDIRRKLFNSASARNYGNRLEEIAKHFENWKSGDPAYLGGKDKRILELIETVNWFDIDI